MFTLGTLKILAFFLGILFKHIAVPAHFAFGFAGLAVGNKITIRVPCTAIKHLLGFQRFACKDFTFIALRTFNAQCNWLYVLTFGIS